MGKSLTSADQRWDDYGRSAPSAPSTPWGKAQHVYNLDRGVRWFSTAGHGGLMVADGVARAKLSDAARKEGEHWGGAYWYEEDVGYAVAFLENLDWAMKMHQKGGGSLPTKEMLERTVRQWFPTYFTRLEQGFKLPDALKPGDRIRFEREISFGRGTVFHVGDVALVKTVTRSGLVFHHPHPASYGLYRLPTRYYLEGQVTKLPPDAKVDGTGLWVPGTEEPLRAALLKLANEVPGTRKYLIPLLREHR